MPPFLSLNTQHILGHPMQPKSVSVSLLPLFASSPPGEGVATGDRTAELHKASNLAEEFQTSKQRNGPTVTVAHEA